MRDNQIVLIVFRTTLLGKTNLRLTLTSFRNSPKIKSHSAKNIIFDKKSDVQAGEFIYPPTQKSCQAALKMFLL